MDLLNSIVKAEHISRDPCSLRAVLERYGEIATFLPYNTNDGDSQQCFLRYSTSKQAQKAFDAQDTVQGLRVFMLSQDPSLLNQYIALHASNVAQDEKHKRNEYQNPPSPAGRRAYIKKKDEKSHYPKGSRPPHAVTSPPRSNAKTLYKTVDRRERVRPVLRTPPTYRVRSRKDYPKGRCFDRQATDSKENSKKQSTPKARSTRGAHSPFRTPSILSRLRSPYLPGRSEEPPNRVPLVQPLNTTCDGAEKSTIALPGFSMATHIELNVVGEQFVYDLKKLEDDPKSIIELLKLASAERGHWMIVAAFYRRRGNPRAAIKLLMELIEVLKHHDVHEDKMKPMYLMLSGCEADLATSERNANGDSRSSSGPYQNSQTWLEKVYGTFGYAHGENRMTTRPKSPPNKGKNNVSPTRLSCNSYRPNPKLENCPRKRPNDVQTTLHDNKRRKSDGHYRIR